MIGVDIEFKSDAKTKHPLRRIVTEETMEIRLTNEERNHLLTIFNFKGQSKLGVMLLALAFFAFVMGIITCGITAKETENTFGVIAGSFMPSIVLLLVGIYVLYTAPNLEKSILKAYEFTVTDIMHRYYVKTSEDDPQYYEEEKFTEITKTDAAKYDPVRKDVGKRYYLFLQLDGKWVMLKNNESYSPIRFGIKIGDKVRCAVLECGEYCYISLY